MTHRKYEARMAVARQQASKLVALTIDNSKDTALLFVLQANWVRRRHGLGAEHARVIADLAFTSGRRA